jgi:hypothetical protein
MFLVFLIVLAISGILVVATSKILKKASYKTPDAQCGFHWDNTTP